ncbi:MAG TPA: arylsulfatase [Phycisphaerae bacterium]|nr:arylsulfatase [Phycisphaerae bacterium]
MGRFICAAVIRLVFVAVGGASAGVATAETQSPPDRPNIVFIMADDLGYADLGCYGQEKIRTPNLDRMAAEGLRFTQAYCGTSVCAPSRCILMTGLHGGHSYIRANKATPPEGQEPIPAGTFTVARMLQQAGYRTACIGKWGLGGTGSSGAPEKQGFDHFFGYICQSKAHEYYPEYLWRNGQRVELDGRTYSHDLMADDALKWVRDNRDRPFFLYLPFTIPHSKLQVPDLGPYADEPWIPEAKAFAAMIARMDRDIGRLLDLLKELGLDTKTLVMFTSDNGSFGGRMRDFFKSGGELRGIKRSMYEGGLRVPMIARWPGHVPAGKVSDEPWAFYDFLPTCAEVAAARPPAGLKLDGISVLPALLGGRLPAREYLYWELHEPHSQQAARFGDIKAVRPGWNAPIEIYDLKADPGEQHNLAGVRPELVKKAEGLLKSARVDSTLWPIKLPRAATATASRPAGNRE